MFIHVILLYNPNDIGFSAELFMRGGKSMHAKSPCSLPWKVWQDLYNDVITYVYCD